MDKDTEDEFELWKKILELKEDMWIEYLDFFYDLITKDLLTVFETTKGSSFRIAKKVETDEAKEFMSKYSIIEIDDLYDQLTVIFNLIHIYVHGDSLIPNRVKKAGIKDDKIKFFIDKVKNHQLIKVMIIETERMLKRISNLNTKKISISNKLIHEEIEVYMLQFELMKKDGSVELIEIEAQDYQINNLIKQLQKLLGNEVEK